MNRGRVSWVVAAIAAGLSILRVRLANPAGTSAVLWAEDGLWALCARKAGPLTCALDPYAGYLQTPPRLIAGLVSLAPWHAWPIASNVAAALCWGGASAIVYAIFEGHELGKFARLMLAILPVTIPIAGVEVANTVANLNFPILYCAIIGAVAFTPRTTRQLVISATMLVVAILSIASAMLVLPVVALRVWRQRRGIAGRESIPLGLGALAALWQSLAILSAGDARPLSVGRSTVVALIDFMPDALTSLVPGLSFGPLVLFEEAWIPSSLARLVVGLALPVAVVALLTSAAPRHRLGGAIAGLGLVVTALPTLAFGPVNRYFVVLAATSFAGFVVAVAPATGGRRRVGLTVGSLLLGLLWAGHFPVSPFRAADGSNWVQELEEAQSRCDVGQSSTTVMFAPNWPFEPAALSEPTTNVVTCQLLGGSGG